MTRGGGGIRVPKRLMSERARADVWFQFDRYGFDQKGWSDRTRYRYGTQVKATDRWLRANRDVSVVWATPKDLAAYLFQTKPTPQTRNDVRAALVAFGHFLVKCEWRPDNPALGLPRLPCPRSVPKALDLDQAQRLARASAHFSQMHHAMVMLMLYGGFRRDEVRLLEWHRVGDGGKWVTVLGKGKRERQIPIHEDAAVLLAGWKLACPAPRWVFPSPRNVEQPMSTTTMAKTIRMIGEAAGIVGLHPHALRHTMATRMLEQTGDLRVVQVFLGHARPETTAIYTKVRPAKLEEASARLDF
jgi:site-specific recombinase XerD